MPSFTSLSSTSPELSWPNGQPFSQRFNDPYFSVANGLEESRYVFLKHNGLPERWLDWPWQQHKGFCIIETGFGTGLNFLMTWQAWRHYQQTQTHGTGWLHFTSIEKYPLNKEQLQQALDLWPALHDLAAKLLERYPVLNEGEHCLAWPDERISLTLYWGDIKQALPEINGPVHAWYLDGFAPARNPDMWDETLFAQMRLLSQKQQAQYDNAQPATVATFTAAGLVRRGLQGAGFEVNKPQGYGHKRAMLAGVFKRTLGPERPPYFLHKPWLVSSATTAQEVIVIGAGLAGCTTARALAERGIKVRVIDATGIAKCGSGNPQGGLYIKLAANEKTKDRQFYLNAYQYAIGYLQHYLGSGDQHNPDWQQCGMLQLAFNAAETKRQQQLLATTTVSADIAYPVDAEQASRIAQVELESGGLFFPQGGWVNPSALCKKLLTHPQIDFQTRKVTQLEPLADGWCVHTNTGPMQATDLVLATAYATHTLLPNLDLATQRTRGQLSYIKPEVASQLRTVISGQSFVTPENAGLQCIGATFSKHNDNPEIQAEDHQFNLDKLKALSPQWRPALQQLGLKAIEGGRVGFRCATKDHLPCVGQVPDRDLFIQRFALMARDAKQIAPVAAPNMRGLWLNIGHGAKGLASTPLCAELLACQMTESTAPISNTITEALWPGRFLVRDLIRKRI